MKVNWNDINIPRTRTAILSWHKDYPQKSSYAAITHEGGTTHNGVFIAPRPWVSDTINNFTGSEFNQSRDYHVIVSQDIEDWFDAIAFDFGQACQTQMEQPVYEWNRVTTRKNKTVVSSPRDIIDMGELRDSYQIEFI